MSARQPRFEMVRSDAEVAAAEFRAACADTARRLERLESV